MPQQVSYNNCLLVPIRPLTWLNGILTPRLFAANSRMMHNSDSMLGLRFFNSSSSDTISSPLFSLKMATLPDRTVTSKGVSAPSTSPEKQGGKESVPVPAFHFQEFVKNDQPGKLGVAVTTRVNYFVVTPPKTDTLQVYDIKFAQIAGGRDIKNRGFKKELIQSLLRQPGFAQHAQDWASDYNDSLISLQKDLQPPPTPHFQSMTLRNPAANISQDSPVVPVYQVTVPAQGGNPVTFGIQIKLSHKLLKSELRDFVSAKGQLADSEWLNALNVITRKHAAQNNVKVGADKFFPQQAGTSLGSGLNARRGFFSSIRPVTNKIVLNMHGVTTAFIDSGPLYTFPSLQYPGEASRNGVPHYSGPPQQSRDFDRRFKMATKGIRVRILYDVPTKDSNVRSKIRSQPDPHGKIKRINGFGNSATNQMFNHSTLGQISVANYFNKHVLSPDTPLRRPQLLVCNLGTSRQPNYVPSELLHIVPDQPFTGHLSPGATSVMIGVAQRKPTENVTLIEGAFQPGNMFDSAGLRQNGVEVLPKMLEAKARFLPIPELVFKSQTKERGGATGSNLRSGSWNLKGGKKFHTAGRVDAFGVINLSSKDIPTATYQKLADGLKTYGIDGERLFFTTKAQNCQRASLQAALQTLRTLAAPKEINFVLVMLPDGSADSYHAIKWWADTQDEAAVHTICVTPGKQQKLTDLGFQANLALKFNAKALGRNHVLGDSALKLLYHEGSTMVMGADVTHPGPGSVTHCPSIAAVVASTDRFAVNYPGSLRLQTSKQEVIADLAEMVEERLGVWHDGNSKLPSNILFYRDGVSESQFAAVRDDELVKIQKGCQNAAAKYNQSDYLPKITLIVCGKRHHTRFYPSEKAKKSTTSSWVSRSSSPNSYWEVY